MPHGEDEQPIPQKLEEGMQYVFHHRAPIDNELLALKEFPSRLSQRGFKILKAPKSTGDLLYLTIGGPLFSIRFSDGNRKFVIFNQLDTVGLPWAGHDYILVVKPES